MKRYQIIYLLMALFFLFACIDDNSAYISQEKEDIKVDDVNNEDHPEEGDEDEILPEGQLVPGVHTVKLNVTQPDGQVVERKFKYYMPVSTNTAKPISLVFEFHGSYEFDKGHLPSNPLAKVSITGALAQNAIKENCVVCYPAGEVVYSADSSGYVNWQNSEHHLPFVDAMIDYFKGCTPTIDANRIYSTGQSSGAIFSFVLAFERSEVFAAITPRAGQMSLADQTHMPSRAVPVRVFAGETDKTVVHSAVLENMTAWAEKVGGYFTSDMVTDTMTIKNYAPVTIRRWSGARADIEMYSLAGIGHDISEKECMPYMWEFMAAHTLDGNAENLFITTSLKEMDIQCGEIVTIDVSYTDGATLELTDAPEGWDIRQEGNAFIITGPKDFFANIDRKGKMIFKITKDGQTTSAQVSYKLVAPKTYFEVGDIYYNDDFEPVGVVCWVNNANIKEAKIINIDEHKSVWYCGSGNGLGIDFDTPDANDGEGNTQKMVDKNNTFETPYTAGNAAFAWAATLNYKGVTGWYLPAINELEAIKGNLETVNETIRSLGGVEVKNPYSWGSFTLYSSTTEVKPGATTKTLYYYDYDKGKQVETKARDAGSEYVGYINARAFKTVSK